MSTFDNICELTSFKDCRDETISRKKVGKILEAGRQGPSPGNVQSIEFLVVEDDHKQEMLADEVGDHRIEEVPTAIIVIGDRDRMARRAGDERAEEFCNSEAACAIQNMRLTAAEEGIGSCWISGFDREAVAGQFRVPEGKLPLGITILGYTDSPVSKSSKFGLNDICFYDTYGNKVESMFDGLHMKGLRDSKKIYGRKAQGLKDKVARRLRKFL